MIEKKKIITYSLLSSLLLLPNFMQPVMAEGIINPEATIIVETKGKDDLSIINKDAIMIEANDKNSIITLLNNLYNKEIKGDVKEVENPQDNLKEYNVGNINIKIENLDLSKLGEQVITINTQSNIRNASLLLDSNIVNQKTVVTDSLKSIKEEDTMTSSNIKYISKIKVNVQDTKKPIIDIKDNITLEEGDSFDLNSYVKITDEIDGEITEQITLKNEEEYNEIKEKVIANKGLIEKPLLNVTMYDTTVKNNYVGILGSVDVNTIGTYTIKFMAVDKYYNITEKELTVNIEKKKDIVEKNMGHIIDWMNARVGNPYVWGGNGPVGYDCSGLMQQMYYTLGISIPRVAQDQSFVGEAVSLDMSTWRTGDMLFFTNASGYAEHVGMYMGDGIMIEAANPRDGIIRHSVNYSMLGENGTMNITRVRRIVQYD